MRVADSIGKQFNHLLVLKKSQAGTAKRRLKVRVRCMYNNCGEEFDSRLDNLVEGRTKSCGCAPRVIRKPLPSKQLRDAIWKFADKIAENA